MAVYFVRAGDSEAIKIGFAKDPFSRIKSMQTSMPDILETLRIIPDGNRDMEQALHLHYIEFHIRGEWFRFHESMLTIDPISGLSYQNPKLPRASPRSVFRTWRYENGFSVADAAKLLGYHLRRMRDYDNGHKHPNRAMLLAMTAISHGYRLNEDETDSSAAA